MIKKVLFAASEIYPFAKTGGLADVAYALPRALKNLYDVTVVMPLYRSIDKEQYSITPLGKSFTISMGGEKYLVDLYGCSVDGYSFIFIYSPILCDREFLYGTPEEGYVDNGIRFALFSYAITELLKLRKYDILHLNDWQCALAALLVHKDHNHSPKVIYTIHNLAYQGIFDSTILESVGIERDYYTMGSLEFYGKVNFMKAGVAYADEVTTVSPTYAREILTGEFGCGLEGFLHFHQNKLSGIINGIDSEHFSPLADNALIAPYSEFKGKKTNKTHLLKQIGFKGINKPLFAFVGRFTSQKGMDLLIETLPKMALLECNIVLLGEGEENYHQSLSLVANEHKNIHLSFGYDEALSHQIYAAADFLLMPSLFEPCGLNQMIAFAYGALPIVHRVGGLVDTVKRLETYQEDSCSGYGLLFSTATCRSLLSVVKKGCELFEDKKHFERVINHNMRCDFSWKESAIAYGELYEKEKK
ncbi:MAG: glycogen synthase [Sulfuricurvum sp.]|uniref:glycogen synthase n=1 Tax=Sulfuricurvum sp. TaxID=2025608 RepID=UPI002611D592|nr:glycogen synthase [Sulfuricurvum sp.]MDD2829489.1 glycogen synthase [Sulfuricurvum sp.]MDD4949514.1 glycogen synthase [Sulfuricurvum sp.]